MRPFERRGEKLGCNEPAGSENPSPSGLATGVACTGLGGKKREVS